MLDLKLYVRFVNSCEENARDMPTEIQSNLPCNRKYITATILQNWTRYIIGWEVSMMPVICDYADYMFKFREHEHVNITYFDDGKITIEANYNEDNDNRMEDEIHEDGKIFIQTVFGDVISSKNKWKIFKCKVLVFRSKMTEDTPFYHQPSPFAIGLVEDSFDETPLDQHCHDWFEVHPQSGMDEEKVDKINNRCIIYEEGIWNPEQFHKECFVPSDEIWLNGDILEVIVDMKQFTFCIVNARNNEIRKIEHIRDDRLLIIETNIGFGKCTILSQEFIYIDSNR
eukprot:334264_1